METWRLLPHHAGSTDLHFRLTDALARRSTVPTVWAHSGQEQTLLLGAGQKYQPLKNDAHMTVVQRQSGGTAVLTSSDVLGVDVFLPRGHRLALDDVVDTYRWFGEVWVEALTRLGVKTRAVSVHEARNAAPVPEELKSVIRATCFGSLSPWEVVASDKKLVGLAQVRRQNGVLLQSAIHLHFDAADLASTLMPVGAERLAAELNERAIGINDLAREPVTLQRIIEAFQVAVVSAQHLILEPSPWTGEELRHAGVTPEEFE